MADNRAHTLYMTDPASMAATGPADHPFDAALALRPQAPGQFAAATAPAWANMVGPFGGITAAQALAAVLHDPRRLGEPVAITVNYCAPVADGEFALRVDPVRSNRSTQHWTLALEQGGGIALTGTVLTALRREGWRAAEAVMPLVPPPERVPAPDQQPPVQWLRRYDMRFVQGSLPAWGGVDPGVSLTRLWVRDALARPLDACALVALSDVFFPRVWLRRAQPLPAGTVSFTVYLHADAAMLARAGSDFVLAQARGQAFADGFADQTGQLWSRCGDLLATTHQLCYYKDAT